MSDTKHGELCAFFELNGLNEQAACKMANNMEQLGEDIKSFYNSSPEEMLANFEKRFPVAKEDEDE